MSSLLTISTELFHDQILAACEKHGDAVALTDADSGRSLTFRDIRILSYRFASAFKQQGIGKDDIVLVSLPNCPEYPLVLLGLALNGAVMAGVPSDLKPYEFSTYLEHAGSRFVVTDSEHAEAVKKEGIKIILIESLLERREDELEQELAAKLSIAETITPDSILVAAFSSGTTGTPKCALLTHDNYSTVTAALKVGLFDALQAPRQSTVAMLPFYHASGFWSLLFCILEGHHSIIMRSFNVGQMLELIAKYEVSTLNLVPSIVAVLARIEISLPSIRIVLCGSAPLGKELSEALLQRHPSIEHLIQGYGMTEVVVLSHATPPRVDNKYGSCGKLLPGFEAKIVDENGVEVGVTEQGELLLRGRAVMRSYLRDGSPLDDEDWLRTGDLVSVDHDGFYYIIDRLKDVFKVHGKQVSPAEIEDLLLSHPSVAEAAVIGIPDEHAGTVPRAFVVLSSNLVPDEVIVAAISKFVQERLSFHKHLKGGVKIVEELPRSASGKVLRRMLAEL